MSTIYQDVDTESHTDIIAHLDGAVSATYQQVDIESHTDIVASLEGAQCPQHTNKLRSNLIQTSWRTKMVPSVLIVLSVYNIPTS